MTTDKSLGIACPLIIVKTVCRNYPQNLGLNQDEMLKLFSRRKSGAAISDITNKFIVFRVYSGHRPLVNASEYAYNNNWETILIQRQYLMLNLEALELYDAIITNTKHWGKPAEMALEFLAQTME